MALTKIIQESNPFLNNKYTKWYLKLVSKPYEDSYVEKHHILPKCLFPEYEKSDWNIVKLSAKAHFVAHLLLTKMFEQKDCERKMLWAVTRMKGNNGKCKKYFNASLYENIKKRISEIGLSAEHIEKVAAKKRGVKLTESQKNKISQTMRSKKMVRGKMPEETKKKMIETKKANYVSKIWMHKDDIQTKVELHLINNYLNAGWLKGTKGYQKTYSEKTKQKSIEQWQKVKSTGHTGQLIKVC